MTAEAGWLSAKRIRWRQMSGREKMFALVNLLVDTLLFLFLLGMVWIGAARDPYAYVFWVPFLMFVLFMRFKQAGQRWTVRST